MQDEEQVHEDLDAEEDDDGGVMEDEDVVEDEDWLYGTYRRMCRFRGGGCRAATRSRCETP